MKVQTVHKCNICDRIYPYSKFLMKHIKTFHENVKTFECDYCGIHSLSTGNLQKHISSVHKGQKRFECDICERRFSVAATLLRHIQAVHEKI